MLKQYVLTVGIVVLAGCGDNVRLGPMEHETKTLDLDKSEMTRAELKMGAGEMRVGGGAVKLMEGNFDYNDPARSRRWNITRPACEAISKSSRQEQSSTGRANGMCASMTPWGWIWW